MDKELPISPWPEWKIISKIGEGSFGRVYKAQRTEKGRSFYSAIKIITIPASKGELDSVRSESGDEKSVRGYFENLVEECIQEVSTMEYFRGNSHIVSVEDYKVMEYLDEIVEEYKMYANEHQSIVNATLRYVTAPADNQLEGIKKFLMEEFDAHQVELEMIRDERLVGGFVLAANGREWDWSISGRIRGMQEQLGMIQNQAEL